MATAEPVSDPPAAPEQPTVLGVFEKAKVLIREKPVQRKLVAEFFGTFTLVFTVGCNNLNPEAFNVISIAASLTTMVYALGPISGANLNPAVSTALFLAGKLEVALFTLYVTTQLGAGLCAGTCFSILFGRGAEFGFTETNNWVAMIVVEFCYAFMLCFVVLTTACRSGEPNQYFGLAIGGVIVAGGTASGWISGGAL
eukprot:CAMPEP_0173384118 /NCGR_PEP_ID=MMETSP1356-20130122/6683_1 /TAXON_ID=77927 ORGANISM="Hemiselmis virescens, Strain PCC157" /NCGR_SAMPLE_ID=MMETSP1356 /ASSEMBLY_ACC=CAM_ASM_000847 /LENGTH=197 /DNA_ID=CAMNT_0014339311 /DNA_START=213 /DNA_END=802 /DNA_ORIENTATION=-